MSDQSDHPLRIYNVLEEEYELLHGGPSPLLILLSRLFAPAGGLLLLAAVLGFSGVFLNLFRPKFYWTFEVSVLIMGAATIFLTIVFIVWPAKVLSKLVR